METGRLIAIVVIYIVVGLMMWLQVKTDNDIAIKRDGKPKYMEPKMIKIAIFWLPYMFINAFSRIDNKLRMWLYK